VTLRPVSQAELERQRAVIEADFRGGWIPAGAGQRRTLTAAPRAGENSFIAPDGRAGTGPDRAGNQVVRDGAQPGDPLPSLLRRPFIKGVSDEAEVIITGTGSWQYVAVLFSHESFPGVRFGHRFAPPPDKHAPVWLMEEIETGALHRMMQDQPAADDAGIVWTTWGATAPSNP
jgi:hypothetical protein